VYTRLRSTFPQNDFVVLALGLIPEVTASTPALLNLAWKRTVGCIQLLIDYGKIEVV
jgi:hypothetical protein